MNKTWKRVLFQTFSFVNKKFSRLVLRLGSHCPELRYYPSDVLSRTVAEYPEYEGIDTLIETGTFMGDVAFHEKDFFKEVHTIEIKEDIYMKTKKRLSPWPNIHCHLGDSVEVLGKILKSIKRRSIFFLDAHWSGDHTVDWSKSDWQGYPIDTGFRGAKEKDGSVRSENQVPLNEEIRLISQEHPYASVIIIDDWRSIGTKNQVFQGEDWTSVTIDRILSIIKKERVRAIFTMDSCSNAQNVKFLIILLFSAGSQVS